MGELLDDDELEKMRQEEAEAEKHKCAQVRCHACLPAFTPKHQAHLTRGICTLCSGSIGVRTDTPGSSLWVLLLTGSTEC